LVLLSLAALLATALVGALTFAIVDSQRDARVKVFERFDQRAELSAQLLAGTMSLSSTRQGADAGVRLAGKVDSNSLKAWEGEADPSIPYTAVYDDAGTQLAIHPRGASVSTSALSRSALKSAATGQASSSGLIETPDGPVIESYVPFPSASGIRVLVIAVPSELTVQLADGALKDVWGTRSGGAYVLDRTGTVIAAVGRQSRTRDLRAALSEAARKTKPVGSATVGDVRYAMDAVEGSGLVVALVAPVDELTATTANQAWPRLALAGLAGALILVFWLGFRALRDARRLDAARADAQRANEAKSQFLAHITHEIKNPLGIIRGFGDLLTHGAADEEQRGYARYIMAAEQQLLGLVNELLDIARIEAGKMTLSLEQVDLHGAVDEVARLAMPLAAERKVQLNVTEDEVSRVALADPVRLRQVLLNLVSNAIKYCGEGGRVTLTAREAAEQSVCVEVTDSGEGIAPDRLDRLFEPFDRLGKEGGHAAGTGLGLVITKGLVEAMHGQLQVASTLGQGTTFTVELPSIDSAQATAAIRDDSAPPANHGTIVYVDDHAPNLDLVQQIIAASRPGLSIRTATDGEAGSELIDESPPDLLLLDLNLPDMTGEQLLRRVRNRDATAELPVLILSSDSTSRDVMRLLRTGADAYLTKPFEQSQLLSVVDRLLASRSD
jgi:signal transduction histidine kinase/CheY-like chemotaxis protein